MMASRSQRSYRRRRWVVNPSFQYRFIGIMLLVLLLLAFGALGSVYLSLWITLQTFGLDRQPLAVAQMTGAALMVTLELLLIAPLVIWIGVRLTHKVAGPLMRINAALQQMAQGDFNIHLTLRKGDSLIELADAINVLAANLRREPANKS